jgi:hypothetical protein
MPLKVIKTNNQTVYTLNHDPLEGISTLPAILSIKEMQ